MVYSAITLLVIYNNSYKANETFIFIVFKFFIFINIYSYSYEVYIAKAIHLAAHGQPKLIAS